MIGIVLRHYSIFATPFMGPISGVVTLLLRDFATFSVRRIVLGADIALKLFF
jgi:hypothetical protein